MRQLRWTTCVAACLLAGSTARQATAQYTPPGLPQGPTGLGGINNPVYSPYLNLLRPGGSLTQNYFGLVRPELDLRNASGNLQYQQFRNDQYLSGMAYGNGGFQPLVTGHSATFLNLQGRFLAIAGGGGPYGGVGNRGGGVGNRGVGNPGTSSGGYNTTPYGQGGYGNSFAGYGPSPYGAGAGYGNFGSYGTSGYGGGYGGGLPAPGGYGGYGGYGGLPRY